ncbi:aldo/keto reductase [Bacteroidetes/Chlorobi group bacterium MS-B_bin-24]|jgi:diketogulonate reductase-like aldo/keto reductase|nr:MAG: aldo/keto reductase [Bacteroidetes/Chlorobi group bacterium MS-B_bin-24]
MNLQTKITLNNKVKIPVLGLGTYLMKPGEETYNACRWALEFGYRHIDTASFYRNEEDVGRAVRNSGIDRKDVFITTKVWNDDQGYDKTLRAVETSLKKLGFDYIDLILVHWPVPGLRKETWKALEKVYDEGISAAIGVSNYTIAHLQELFNYANVIPVVNQVEFSPFLYQKELKEFCEENNIYIEAYSPLVRGRKFDHPLLVELSRKYQKTPAQILIRWALQIGTIVIPKSSRKERIIENASVFDFEISDEDMAKLNSLSEGYRVAWNPEKVE